MWYWIALAAPFVLWVLLHMKTSRPDGEIIKVHPYRRIMWYIMPTRNESVVYFDSYVIADEVLRYVEDLNKVIPCTLNDVLVAAVARGLIQTPEMDRFVAGHRLYQRYEPSITFSMKRERKNKKSKISTVKQVIRPDHTILTMIQDVRSKVKVERSDKKTTADTEFQVLNLMPRPMFRGAFSLVRLLDYFNLLPGFFIKTDPMHTSIFMANLGSVNMAAGYHHLYEYGTCPLFIMIGKLEDKPMVVDGEVVVKPVIHIRFSYDERIDDGMTAGNGIYEFTGALENPYEILGCVGEDDAYEYGAERPRHWKRTDE